MLFLLARSQAIPSVIRDATRPHKQRERYLQEILSSSSYMPFRDEDDEPIAPRRTFSEAPPQQLASAGMMRRWAAARPLQQGNPMITSDRCTPEEAAAVTAAVAADAAADGVAGPELSPSTSTIKQGGSLFIPSRWGAEVADLEAYFSRYGAVKAQVNKGTAVLTFEDERCMPEADTRHEVPCASAPSGRRVSFVTVKRDRFDEINKSKLPTDPNQCRWFAIGDCRKGSTCNLVHPMSPSRASEMVRSPSTTGLPSSLPSSRGRFPGFRARSPEPLPSSAAASGSMKRPPLPRLSQSARPAQQQPTRTHAANDEASNGNDETLGIDRWLDDCEALTSPRIPPQQQPQLSPQPPPQPPPQQPQHPPPQPPPQQPQQQPPPEPEPLQKQPSVGDESREARCRYLRLSELPRDLCTSHELHAFLADMGAVESVEFRGRGSARLAMSCTREATAVRRCIMRLYPTASASFDGARASEEAAAARRAQEAQEEASVRRAEEAAAARRTQEEASVRKAEEAAAAARRAEEAVAARRTQEEAAERRATDVALEEEEEEMWREQCVEKSYGAKPSAGCSWREWFLQHRLKERKAREEEAKAPCSFMACTWRGERKRGGGEQNSRGE